MGKWWDRDPRDMTILEFINSPISTSAYTSRASNKPRQYQYYDTPDGQDIDKKMWVVTKWGLGFGTFMGLIDVKMYSNPRTIFDQLNRMAFFVLPVTGMFVTYGAITYTLTNLRGVDSALNSAIGGATAGSLAGVWLKNGQVGLWGAILGGLFCMARKHADQEGHKMFNPLVISHMYSSHVNLNDYDYSLTPIGERGWTTGAE